MKHTSAIHIERTSVPISLFRYFAILAALTILAGTAFAQRPRVARVDAGKNISFSFESDINPEGYKVDVFPTTVADAFPDFDKNRFVIEGLAEGTARIVFTGTKRGVEVARADEKKVPFRIVFDVTVLPRYDVDTLTRRLDITKGKPNPFSVGYLMSPRQEFANPNAEGRLWRNLRYTGGDDRVAIGDLSNGKLTIDGIADGRTTVFVQGERRIANTWQRVERKLILKVGTGIKRRADKPKNNDPPKPDANGDEPKPENEANTSDDPVLDGIIRRYDGLKAGANGGGNPLTELEQFAAYLEQEIKKEGGRTPTRFSRLGRLQVMLEKTKEMIGNMKSKPVGNATSPLAGNWYLLVNGQRQSGEYTFLEGQGITTLMNGSKTWLLVFNAKEPIRKLALPAGAQDQLGLARRFAELRGDAASRRLEFWITADELSMVFRKTNFVLVRENK